MTPRRGASRGGLLAAALLIVFLLAVPAVAEALPDGRAYEQVSQPDKHGGSVLPLGLGTEGLIGGDVQASKDGQSLTYDTDSPPEPNPQGNRANESSQILARRSSAPAWSNKDIVTPAYHAEGLNSGNPQEYLLFSTDLSTAILAPFGVSTRPLMEPPLVSSSPEERSVYQRDNVVCESSAAGCYQALVNPENETGTTEGKRNPYGGQLEVLGASPDATHVVLGSAVTLTAATPAEASGGLYESSSTKPAAEQLQFVSMLPNGAPAEEPGLGAIETEEQRGARNAVSMDGSRVFWSGIETAGTEELPFRYLFMRDTETGTTIHLDAAEPPVKEVLKEPAAKNRRVRYQAASEDGSRIFFTSNAPLTTASKVKPKEEEGSEGKGPVNLYVCEIPTTAPVTSSTRCKLHDLTAKLKGGVGDVVGEVSAVSADGKTVYFAANNELEGSAKKAGKKCPNPTSQSALAQSEQEAERCDLYVAHLAENGEWEGPTLIAELSGADHPDWGGAGLNLWGLTTRTSPSGEWFAFMSELPLTGYNNEDLSPAAHEGGNPSRRMHDEEVFLYNRKTGKTICPSCNTHANQRPKGIFDEAGAGEGVGPLVDPGQIVWRDRWIAGSIPGWTAIDPHDAPYQSRYLLDSGRLYFNSADSLVAHDAEERNETAELPLPSEGGQTKVEKIPTKVGVENVYQYEPETVGSCQAGEGSLEGCVSLISSGTSPNESAFLDASATGEDVFFATSAKLVPADTDEALDAYDARVCAQSTSGCVQPSSSGTAGCTGEADCRGTGPAQSPSFESAPSSTYSGPGNSPKVEVLGATSSKPKPLTKAQKLAKALAACRKKFKHSKHKRQACERQAHRAYGAKHASTKSKKK